MSDAYQEFLANKARAAAAVGFDVQPDRLPEKMKAFQAAITGWALRRGCAALFEGTGLGKTVQELAWAQEVRGETKKPVLIEAPLAVAEQIVDEAKKFDIDGVAYAASQEEAKTPIVVSNYDLRHKFDFEAFGGVVLDESGILKAHDGKTRAQLTEACARVPYRLCATATPAPNDWTEIGQHAEFLGVMRAKEMLAMYFVHDGAIRANEGSASDGWRLKRHAERDFWAWVASWSVMIQSPADLGFEEAGYDLPPLRKHQITVPVEHRPPDGALFQFEAQTMAERLAARRQSLPQRVDYAADLVRSAADQPWVLWCNLNDEADALVRAIPGAVQIAGSEPREEKRRKLVAFSKGEIKDLVTKPSVAGFGMNWQHCHATAFVGLNDSFEQVYQAIRRFWRFGQLHPVDAYMIASELEGAVVANQDRKERDFERMQAAMADHMRDFTRRAVLGGRIQTSTYAANQQMEIPAWLTAA